MLHYGKSIVLQAKMRSNFMSNLSIAGNYYFFN
jgi:hypothetical protein